MQTFNVRKIFTVDTIAMRAGDTHEEEITFESHRAFDDWARDINRRNAEGKLPYKIG